MDGLQSPVALSRFLVRCRLLVYENSGAMQLQNKEAEVQREETKDRHGKTGWAEMFTGISMQ